ATVRNHLPWSAWFSSAEEAGRNQAGRTVLGEKRVRPTRPWRRCRAGPVELKSNRSGLGPPVSHARRWPVGINDAIAVINSPYITARLVRWRSWDVSKRSVSHPPPA